MFVVLLEVLSLSFPDVVTRRSFAAEGIVSLFSRIVPIQVQERLTPKRANTGLLKRGASQT